MACLDETLLLGEFMQAWANFERTLTEAAANPNLNFVPSQRVFAPMLILDTLVKEGYLSRVELEEINQIRKTRNEVVHGVVNFRGVIKPEMSIYLATMTTELQKRFQSDYRIKSK